MIKIIITGTIGSGKSEFRKLLQSHIGNDVTFVDIDELVNSLYDDTDFQDTLISEFGITDKKEISKIVFSDKSALTRLNDLVREILEPELQSIALYSGHVVLEIPLFFEMMLNADSIVGLLRDKFTVITVSMRDVEKRNARIVERCKIKHPHWSNEQIQEVINSQLPDFIKEGLADVVFYNDGTLDELELNVIKFVDFDLTDLSGASTPPISEYAFGARNTVIPNNIFRIVSHKYTETHRFYHDVSHINNMCSLLMMSDVRDDIKRNTALQLAILFHDVIYDPKSSENEENSVRFMFSLIDLLGMSGIGTGGDICDPEVLEQAAFMILSTKKHVLTKDEDAEGIYDDYPDLKELTSIFLDLDLSVFNPDRYESGYVMDDYEDRIRKEYRFVPDEEYYPARIKILQSFANREKIYFSDIFGSEANNNAKASLKYLIIRLMQKMEDL